MVRTVEQILAQMLGEQQLRIAILLAQLEATQESKGIVEPELPKEQTPPKD